MLSIDAGSISSSGKSIYASICAQTAILSQRCYLSERPPGKLLQRDFPRLISARLYKSITASALKVNLPLRSLREFTSSGAARRVQRKPGLSQWKHSAAGSLFRQHLLLYMSITAARTSSITASVEGSLINP